MQFYRFKGNKAGMHKLGNNGKKMIISNIDEIQKILSGILEKTTVARQQSIKDQEGWYVHMR